MLRQAVQKMIYGHFLGVRSTWDDCYAVVHAKSKNKKEKRLPRQKVTAGAQSSTNVQPATAAVGTCTSIYLLS